MGELEVSRIREIRCGVAGAGLCGTVLKRMFRRRRMHLNCPTDREEHRGSGQEFSLALAVIEARSRVQLTQEELSCRMGRSQLMIARLESGRASPSLRCLKCLAKATGMRLTGTLDPRDGLNDVGLSGHLRAGSFFKG